MRIGFGLLAGMLIAAPATGEFGDRKTFEITRATTAPVIDGRLSEAAWQVAADVRDFRQIDPENGATPTEDTIVRVMYDDDYLYIGAELRDANPSLIRAMQLVQGRRFFSDDRFFVMIDSFNNKRNDYFFQSNPNGIRRSAAGASGSRCRQGTVAGARSRFRRRSGQSLHKHVE